jgi:hypothetical protein
MDEDNGFMPINRRRYFKVQNKKAYIYGVRSIKHTFSKTVFSCLDQASSSKNLTAFHPYDEEMRKKI